MIYQQLAMTEANLEAARQSRAASDRRLESLAQERDKAAGELNEARDEVAQLRAEGEEIERAKADEVRFGRGGFGSWSGGFA